MVKIYKEKRKMRSIMQHETLGPIVYEENFWTGKKNILINNTPLIKQKKKLYLYSDGTTSKTVHVMGNFVTGTKLVIDGETIEITPRAKWYEIACSIFIFALNMIWGNSVALCSIFPIVGGAIGGGISGIIAMGNLLAMKSVKSVALKLVIWLAMLAAMLFICFLVEIFLISLLV